MRTFDCLKAGAVVELEQGSKAWLEWRRKGIGASEVFSLVAFAGELGFSEPNPLPVTDIPAWVATPRTLYGRKTDELSEFKGNADTERGHRLEPGIRDFFNEKFRVNASPLCLSAGAPWNASLDGLAEKGTETAILAEIKAPRRMYESLPVYYRWQVLYQRAVVRAAAKSPKGLNLRSGLIAGVEEANPETGELTLATEIFPVEGNLAAERYCLRLVKFFWDTYIVPKKQPPAVRGDVEYRLDSEFVEAAMKYAAAAQHADPAVAKAKKLKAELISVAGEFHGTLIGGGVRLTHVSRTGSIEYKKAFADLLPDADLEPYRKDSTESVTVKAEDDAKAEESSDSKVTPLRKRA